MHKKKINKSLKSSNRVGGTKSFLKPYLKKKQTPYEFMGAQNTQAATLGQEHLYYNMYLIQ